MVALLAHHQDVLTQAVDVEVAHGDGLQQRDAVLVDLLHTRARTAEDGELHVVERHRDDGVLAQALVDKLALDVLPHLVAREARNLDVAENREVDLAVVVDGIGRVVLAAAHHVDTAITAGDVEKLHQLLVAAVDVDAQLVAGHEADITVLLRIDRHVLRNVLEVRNVTGRLTRGEQRHTQQNQKS